MIDRVRPIQNDAKADTVLYTASDARDRGRSALVLCSGGSWQVCYVVVVAVLYFDIHEVITNPT